MNQTATQTRTLTKLDSTKKMLSAMEKQFQAALPKQITSQKFVRTVMTAISDPMISQKINAGQLDTNSLMSACMKAASDGLLLDGREAAMLTFYSKAEQINKAQYIPMVGGLMKKARNSGEIVDIVAEVVYQNDKFERWVDEKGSHFTWKPCEDSTARGEPRRVFALGITKNGGSQLQVLEKADIDAIASHSKNSDQYSPQKGPWFAEWWKKAAIRRVCKYLPSSADLDRLFEHDNENYDMDEQEHIFEVVPVQTAAKETKASQAIKAKASQPAPEKQPPAEDITEGDFEDIPPATDDDIPI